MKTSRSLCYSCSFVCPAKVDLAEQIYLWRQDLDKLGKADRMKKVMSGGMEFMMNRPSIFNMALKWAPLVNGVPRFLIYNGLNDWGKGREAQRTYRFHFFIAETVVRTKEKRAEQALLEQYTQTLEKIVRQYPEQWFNYYPFWT